MQGERRRSPVSRSNDTREASRRVGCNHGDHGSRISSDQGFNLSVPATQRTLRAEAYPSSDALLSLLQRVSQYVHPPERHPRSADRERLRCVQNGGNDRSTRHERGTGTLSNRPATRRADQSPWSGWILRRDPSPNRDVGHRTFPRSNGGTRVDRPMEGHTPRASLLVLAKAGQARSQIEQSFQTHGPPHSYGVGRATSIPVTQGTHFLVPVIQQREARVPETSDQF